MNLLRWVLTVPLACLGYMVTVLTALLLDSLLNRLCPTDLLVSGMCTAAWYPTAQLGVVALAAAIGAALFVLLPALIAPSGRARVAVVAFATGLAYAGWLLAQIGLTLIVPFSSAAVSGAIVAWCLVRKNQGAN